MNRHVNKLHEFNTAAIQLWQQFCGTKKPIYLKRLLEIIYFTLKLNDHGKKILYP